MERTFSGTAATQTVATLADARQSLGPAQLDELFPRGTRSVVR